MGEGFLEPPLITNFSSITEELWSASGFESGNSGTESVSVQTPKSEDS